MSPNNNESQDPHSYNALASTGFALITSYTATAPLERIKLLFQTQNASPQISKSIRYSGIIRTLRRLPKEQGFLSFWRGNGANVARCFPQVYLNFLFNDFYRVSEHFGKLITRDSDSQENYKKFVVTNLIAGGLAGTSTMSILYPLLLVRNRLAMDIGGRTSSKREFNGIVDCLGKIQHVSGVTGWYRGFFVHSAGIFVHNGMYLALLETTASALNSKNSNLSIPEAIGLSNFINFVASSISYPMETVCHRMMQQAGQKKPVYETTMDCVYKTFKQEGFFGFYKGFLVNLIKGFGAGFAFAACMNVKFTVKLD